ncbi:uncharacterized protein ACR2FA_007527 [Aphomia sociella]
MKKVLFICLLSLATCLSRPEKQEAAPALNKPNVLLTDTKVTNDTAEAPSTPANNGIVAPQIPDDKTKVPAQVPHDTPQNQPPAVKPTEETKTNKSGAAENNTTPDKKKIDPKPAQDETKPADTPKPSDENTTNKNNTNQDANKTVTTTTDAPVPTTTKKNDTQAEITTKPTTTDNTVLQARSFDGASFIGGIILTLGLLAVGLMGFKYYKNQTERNYHTL